MITLDEIKSNVKNIDDCNIFEFFDKVIMAFEDYEINGTMKVIVNRVKALETDDNKHYVAFIDDYYSPKIDIILKQKGINVSVIDCY